MHTPSRAIFACTWRKPKHRGNTRGMLGLCTRPPRICRLTDCTRLARAAETTRAVR